MKRISFNPRFVNKTGDDLIPGKIHTIRENYDYWKHFEGKEVALFTWEGKAYRSHQIVFSTKRIISVQKIFYCKSEKSGGFYFLFEGQQARLGIISQNNDALYKNDGFQSIDDYFSWSSKGYKTGIMSIIHFTDFMYQEGK